VVPATAVRNWRRLAGGLVTASLGLENNTGTARMSND